MNAITGSAASAVRALSSVSAAASTVQTGSFSAGGGGGAGVALMSLPDNRSLAPQPQVMLMSLPDSRSLELPEPEVYLSGDRPMTAPPAVVTLTVQNENHIASEMDAEALLQEMEIRLAEAVASSAEGVYE